MSVSGCHFLYCFVPQADAIVGKLKIIGNQEKDVKPTVVISADTVCLSFPL